MLRNKLRFIKNVFYKLKRSYGLPIQYYRVTSSTTSPETGEKITEYSKTDISKAIVLRAREFRSFVYDLAYISANKDFTTGAFFDPEDRQILIEASDTPINFEPTGEDFIVFQDHRYDVKEIYHFEDNYGWALLVRKLRGAPIMRIESVISILDITTEVSNTITDSLTRTVETILNLTHEISEVP